MKKSRLLCGLLMSAVLFAGCNKKDNKPPDTPSAITISTPNAGTIFVNGGVMHVSGTIIDNNGMAFAKIEIRNKNTGAVYYQQNQATPYAVFYNFDWNWTVTGITTLTPATIKITSTDKYDYQVSKEIDVMLDN